MKKYLKILLFICLLIITVGYTYYIRPQVDDELFNYGFAKNILDGLIPYRDFNMIIPPLFHYLLALILLIFGQKLLIYHIVLALIITTITTLSFKKIKKSAIIIYILLLVYPYTGYNLFCLLLLFLLLSRKEKHADKIDALLISLMFLTKQTLGLLIIPSLFYSKNKKKTLGIYLTALLAFLAYLLLNNNLMSFLDYCIFGMFDFTNKNNTGTSGFFILEIVILLILTWCSFKTKEKNYFYVLAFQIITFPIVDYFHFVISFIPVVYLLLIKLRKNNYFLLYSITTAFTFFLLLNYGIIIKDNNYIYLTHYQTDNFMKGRTTYRLMENYPKEVGKFLEKYSDHTPYILGIYAYFIKLNNDLPINKYDLINNGNMGYHGASKYIAEIDEHCQKNQCIFVINDEELNTKKTIQTNRDILKYVVNNYYKIYSSNIYSIYITKKNIAF